MLAVTRKNQIKEIIIERKSITVTELSKKFKVTEETIRRDLKALEDENFLTRTYGGAFIQSGVENNINTSIREFAYVDSKEKIATISRSRINNGDSIFLDSSTTALFIAKAIVNMRLTVVTNSLLIINQLQDCENIRLISVGGTLARDHKAFQGIPVLDALSTYYFDKAFMSCRTLSMTQGITDSTEAGAGIRRKLLQHSNEIYLVVDHSKFDHNSFITICDFTPLTGIITDKPLSNDWQIFLSQNNTLLLTE